MSQITGRRSPRQRNPRARSGRRTAGDDRAACARIPEARPADDPPDAVRRRGCDPRRVTRERAVAPAPGRAAGARARAAGHPAGAAVVPPGRHRRGLQGRGHRQPDPRGRHPGRARADPGRPGPAARRQPHLAGGHRRPHRAGQAGGRGRRGPRPPGRRCSGPPSSRSATGSRSAAPLARPRPPVCWNGSPYQPIPVAKDVPTDLALRIMEQREEFPGVDADLEAVRAVRRAGGGQRRPPARLPRPGERRRGRPRSAATDSSRCAAPTSSAAPASRSSTTRCCAARPA